MRLWADEYYAGPKPLNCETLLGEIRSRNMSIVPILQDIAQIKTLYPNDKWEIFTGNCATTVFLGSGATAHTTHQWVSDMLEDMTIDSRSESLGHSQGSGNLQMSKAGMKLMTPGQISRMPKNDCILFLKGERPIYDKKNWPFNTEVFKEAEKIAGQNGYKNPVYVSYDERNKKYITTRFESRLNYISKEEFTFFEEKAKEDLIYALENSSDFISTHTIVKKLSAYNEWSSKQIKLLFEIAVSNNQVLWILKDHDIKAFYLDLLQKVDTPDDNVKKVQDIFKLEDKA